MAALLWKCAAEKNHPRAIFNYAQCLFIGDGVEQNREEAAKLFRMCAENFSMPEAQV